MNWDFLFTGPAEDIDRLNDWYLAYYFLNANYVMAIIFVFVLRGLSLIALPLWATGLLVSALLVFVLNAASLRNEMRDLIGIGLPHEGVYTRLKPSGIHSGGIGVFAITDIKKDTNLFEPDNEEMVWMDRFGSHQWVAERNKKTLLGFWASQKWEIRCSNELQ